MDRQVEIRPAAPQDLDAWMELVDQVRWSFPSLDTEEGLAHCRRMIYQGILNKNAFCAWYRGKLAGVVLFSAGRNMLRFLAVAPGYRRRGIATQLLNAMLACLDPERDVVAAVLPAGDGDGEQSGLYEALGFYRKRTLCTLGYPVWQLVRKKQYGVPGSRRRGCFPA